MPTTDELENVSKPYFKAGTIKSDEYLIVKNYLEPSIKKIGFKIVKRFELGNS